MRGSLYFGCLLLVLSSCTHQKQVVHASRNYSLTSLQKDYGIFRKALEDHHPGLYWFTSKDSMDYWFNWGASQLHDSMNEPSFRNILSYVSNQIRCGHTAVRYSKPYTRYIDTLKQNLFPLSIKALPDWMAVAGQLPGTGQQLPRGTILKSINGNEYPKIRDSFFHYLITDGFALNGKYQSLSRLGSFGALYKNLFGLGDSLKVEYFDSSGNLKSTTLTVFKQFTDSLKQRPVGTPRQLPTGNAIRNLQIDTSLSSGYMTINSFSRGNKLKKFYRHSFATLQEQNIRHLVIDVRSNGGGDVGLSTLLTRYIKDRPFKLADSIYAIKRSSEFGKYIRFYLFYKMGLIFVTRKGADGHYHFRYFEKHWFNPIEKNHYNGQVYVVIGGASFSATTIFAHSLQGQSNVKLVGEETGGGAYGNSAWMIPDLKLPETGISFRLPLFRMIMDKEAIASGRGIRPDVYVIPTPEDIRKGRDPKIIKLKEWISKDAASIKK